jgi:hypothetical protein
MGVKIENRIFGKILENWNRLIILMVEKKNGYETKGY